MKIAPTFVKCLMGLHEWKDDKKHFLLRRVCSKYGKNRGMFLRRVMVVSGRKYEIFRTKRL